MLFLRFDDCVKCFLDNLELLRKIQSKATELGADYGRKHGHPSKNLLVFLRAYYENQADRKETSDKLGLHGSDFTVLVEVKENQNHLAQNLQNNRRDVLEIWRLSLFFFALPLDEFLFQHNDHQAHDERARQSCERWFYLRAKCLRKVLHENLKFLLCTQRLVILNLRKQTTCRFPVANAKPSSNCQFYGSLHF